MANIVQICLELIKDPDLCPKFISFSNIDQKLEEIGQRYQKILQNLTNANTRIRALEQQLESASSRGEQQALEEKIRKQEEFIQTLLEKTQLLDEKLVSYFATNRTISQNLLNSLGSFNVDPSMSNLEGWQIAAYFGGDPNDSKQRNIRRGLDRIHQIFQALGKEAPEGNFVTVDTPKGEIELRQGRLDELNSLKEDSGKLWAELNQKIQDGEIAIGEPQQTETVEPETRRRKVAREPESNPQPMLLTGPTFEG